MRCASCGRGGFAKILENRKENCKTLEEFFPYSIEHFNIPSDVPKEIELEFREAEKCAGFGLYRAASALFRSCLEKTLKNNGYSEKSLINKINEAAKDGIITESRKKRANEEVRVLGNDVLHNEWRKIEYEEVEESHKYSQRILEDFYDDRLSVENILKSKNRIE